MKRPPIHVRRKEPVLWIIDNQQWPRACLCAELTERGYETCGFVTLSDAIDALARPATAKPNAVILELHRQNLTREWLEEIQALQVSTILVGGATELNNALLQSYKWSAVLKRPVSLGTVADLVQKLVPGGKKF